MTSTRINAVALHRWLLAAVSMLAVLGAARCASVSDAFTPSAQCVAYPTEPNALVCGQERVFLCTSPASCEARLVDQLRQRGVQANIRLRQQPPGTGREASRDAAAYGEGTTVIKWRALESEGEVVATLDVVTPSAPVQGWASAACFSFGERANNPSHCRKHLAKFTTGELFPVETNADAVAPPTTGGQATILPRVGNQGIYFDPDQCKAQMTSEGGRIECRNVRMLWREVANTHAANQLASELVAAFAAQATVVRRRTLPCSLNAVSASCLALDARMEAAPVGNITAFARAGPRALVASCTWTGTDTLKPAPLCESFFAAEGLTAGP